MLSNGVKFIDLSHTQPKLLNAEHAWGRKFQKVKSTLEVRGHVSTRSCTSLFQNRLFCFITSFDAFKINFQVMFVVVDISCCLMKLLQHNSSI